MKGPEKKTPTRRSPAGESIRRTQRSGRKQAARAAERLGSAPSPTPSIPVGDGLRRAFVAVVVLVALAAIGLAAARALESRGGPAAPAPSPGPGTATAAPTAAGSGPRIGIVSGHRNNDSGAVCADGLTEAQTNFDHAVRVATILRSRGYTVDVLDEFDARLKGYTAAALISIHADSCEYVNDQATGYKVARVLDSKVPAEDDRLVGCLRTRYAASTGLRFHANTITFDMTRYHAFYEIAPTTPAAIIETGFLNLDRATLTRRADAVAQGIVDGLFCFTNGERP
ncbi:MAG: N-acetylmuramoyl-L-alanine amidase [Thermoflexales bacterium]|nr:N-acetylmuramoyl-L-alanine amidase [Thermoflexales bacterium]